MKYSMLAVAGFAASAFAHGYVQNFTADGKYQQGFLLDYYYMKQQTGKFPDTAAWYTENVDIGFVAPDAYATPDINCHKNSAPGAISATVTAGGSLVFSWGPYKWPHPYGPILGYVADCGGDCSKVVKTNLQWVKIAAEGIDYASQVWAQQKLIDQGGKWTLKVPSSLKPGNYVFRHELIALHGANSPNGAQNYPQCFNIKVTGSGTKSLPAGTLGTALYKADHPGILMNPYTKITSYAMPGPTPWAG
ncbi:family 61 glycoside hydrolase, partial [Bimuria novae-zelandiae CBS 107.79]